MLYCLQVTVVISLVDEAACQASADVISQESGLVCSRCLDAASGEQTGTAENFLLPRVKRPRGRPRERKRLITFNTTRVLGQKKRQTKTQSGGRNFRRTGEGSRPTFVPTANLPVAQTIINGAPTAPTPADSIAEVIDVTPKKVSFLCLLVYRDNIFYLFYPCSGYYMYSPRPGWTPRWCTQAANWSF